MISSQQVAHSWVAARAPARSLSSLARVSGSMGGRWSGTPRSEVASMGESVPVEVTRITPAPAREGACTAGALEVDLEAAFLPAQAGRTARRADDSRMVIDARFIAGQCMAGGAVRGGCDR